MQLRICVLQEGDLGFHKKDADGYAHELSGGWKDASDEFAGSQMLHKYNVSLIYYPAPGTGWQSCVEAIKDDKADFSHHHAIFPVIADNVDQGPVIYQYDMAYVTAYRPQFLDEAPDLMDFLSQFNWPFSTLLVLSLMAILALSWWSKGMVTKGTRKKVRRRRWKFLCKAVWSITTATVGSFDLDFLKRMRTLFLSLVLTIVAYRCYSGMIMNTELVVRPQFDILDSAEKLLHHGTALLFEREVDIQLMKRSNDPVMKGIMEQSGGKEILITNWFDSDNARKIITGLLSWKHAPVVIRLMPHETIMCLMTIVGQIPRIMSNHKLLKVDLDRVETPLMGSIINKRMNDSIAKLVRRAMKTAFQENFIAIVYFLNNQRRLGAAGMDLMKDELFSCTHSLEKDQVSDNTFQPTIRNLKWLLVSCLSLLYASFLCLIGESLYAIVFR